MSQFGKIDEKKLFEKKRWLTLKKSAEFLSRLCEDEVDLSDLLKLALENDVKLSLHLNFMPARPCKILNAENVDDASQEIIGGMHRLKFEDKYIAARKDGDNVCLLEDGVYDLIMAGGVPINLNEILSKTSNSDNPQQIGDICKVQVIGSPGIFVESLKGEVYELLTPRVYSVEQVSDTESILNFNSIRREYQPMMRLPLSESSLVVRTNELLKFIGNSALPEVGQDGKKATDEKDEPLYPTAKYSLLRMILGMAMSKYDYKLGGGRSEVPGKIAKSVKLKTDMDIDPDTVKKWLVEAENHCYPSDSKV